MTETQIKGGPASTMPCLSWEDHRQKEEFGELFDLVFFD